MTADAKKAARLANLQRRVAEQRQLEWMRRQQRLMELSDHSASIAKTLDGDGLAWRLFPDMSARHLGRLMVEKTSAEKDANRAALVSIEESKRLETLERRSALLQRMEEQRAEDDQRLEYAARTSRSSLPQA
jgi:hypothetical protein